MEEKLPEGWCWTNLGQCFEVHVGATPSRKQPEYWDGNIPWVSSGEVQFCHIYCTREHITEAGLKNSSTQINPTGSVLLGMIGEGKTRGQVAILDIEACNNQNCAAIWVSQTPIHSSYIYHWLWSQYEVTRQKGSGNNQPALNKSRVEEMTFPLPPLPEQHRIVSVIEQQFTRLDSAIASLKSAQARTKQYRASLLKAAVEGELTKEWRSEHPTSETGEQLLARILKERRVRWEEEQLAKMCEKGITPKDDKWKQKYEEPQGPDVENLPELPDGWCWARAEQLCDFITKGTTPAANKLYNGTGDIPFIKVYNLAHNGRLDFSIKPTFVDKHTHMHELARSKIIPGDILMNIVGPPLGKVSVVPNIYMEWSINQAIAVFRPISGYNRQFLLLSLLTEKVLAWAIKQAKTTAGQHNLTLEICRDLPLPLPPLTEQEQIVSEVEARLSNVAKLEEAIENNLKRAEHERQSILQEAFAGRLVPQDPEDEPASVLLERIREERKQREEAVKVLRVDRKGVKIAKEEPSEKKVSDLGLWNM